MYLLCGTEALAGFVVHVGHSLVLFVYSRQPQPALGFTPLPTSRCTALPPHSGSLSLTPFQLTSPVGTGEGSEVTAYGLRIEMDFEDSLSKALEEALLVLGFSLLGLINYEMELLYILEAHNSLLALVPSSLPFLCPVRRTPTGHCRCRWWRR